MSDRPLVQDLLSDDKYVYSAAVQSWAAYIKSEIANAKREQLRLLKSTGLRSAVWELLVDNEDALTVYVVDSCIRAVEITQRDIYYTTDHTCNGDCADEYSTLHILFLERELCPFGLWYMDVPDYWEYLQVIIEDGKRCNICLQPNLHMCDCRARILL